MCANTPLFYHYSGDLPREFNAGIDSTQPFSRCGSFQITLPPIRSISSFQKRGSLQVQQPHDNGVAVVHASLAQRSSPDDTQIISPIPSRRSSHMVGILPFLSSGHADQAQFCACRPSSTSVVSTNLHPNIPLETFAEMPSRPFARLPISNLLNISPLISQCRITNSTAKPDAAFTDINLHKADGSTVSPSTSNISLFSSSIMLPQAPYSATEQRCILLNKLYHICVEVTASYIRTLLPITRHRQRHYHPYNSFRNCNSSRSTSTPYPNQRSRPATLMDNISTICTHLWRKARNDPMTPHRAEADAVCDMRDLYAWAELVARGMDSDGLLDMELGELDDLDGDGAINHESGWVELDTCTRLVVAAKRICEWLADAEGFDRVRRVEDELRVLEQFGMNRIEGWTGDRVGRILHLDDDERIIS